MAVPQFYGFNLGQIEGLDSSAQTVTVTISNATESNIYTLTYSSIRNGWADSPSPETLTIMLTSSYPNVDGYVLVMFTFDESNVGQTYNIQINAETVEASFKSATEQVINQVTLKTKVLYVSQSDVYNAGVGYTNLPLYRDKSLTEPATSTADFQGYDNFIIQGVSDRGTISGVYIPYYSGQAYCRFIATWSVASGSAPYQPHIVSGTFVDT